MFMYTSRWCAFNNNNNKNNNIQTSDARRWFRLYRAVIRRLYNIARLQSRNTTSTKYNRSTAPPLFVQYKKRRRLVFASVFTSPRDVL